MRYLCLLHLEKALAESFEAKSIATGVNWSQVVPTKGRYYQPKIRRSKSDKGLAPPGSSQK